MFLLVGGDSEIGAATKHHMKAQGLAVAATTRRPECVTNDTPLLDLAQDLTGWTPPPGTHAACVFVAAARLARCHDHPEATERINVGQTLVLADRLLAHGCYVLFLSSNQVFDGSAANVPTDAKTCPVSEYGRQKAQTETALTARMDTGAPIAILRLAKVVSPEMVLLRAWIKSLSSGQPIRAFEDMTMAPAPIGTVTAAITALLQEEARGIFQLTGPRDMSYADVARYIARQIGADPSLITVEKARSSGLPPGAARRHTTLDSAKLAGRYGLQVPDIWDVVDQVIAAARTER